MPIVAANGIDVHYDVEAGIRASELVVFDGCAHAPVSQDPAPFDRATPEVLLRHR